MRRMRVEGNEPSQVVMRQTLAAARARRLRWMARGAPRPHGRRVVADSLTLCLAEAIAWCAPRADADEPERCLRSRELRPPLLWNRRDSAVASLVQQRSARLGRPRPAEARDLAGGRLLVHLPDDDLACGAAEGESRGFFDVFNTPPWDTWVAFGSGARGAVLVSWVPPCLVAAADAGIWANPEQCIVWLDREPELFDQHALLPTHRGA